ncbi:hypothetical protein HPB50_009507 [Hyalomma asiaticum]|uniref:Uncharacterized protein n=1 Tax=Hyalomma asiaticum TaxID=266040 RepID=A0ACB7RIJ0_HYAAI|nr:hypothetical protein HPB50_009507 [Hyalomma asiaticum]
MRNQVVIAVVVLCFSSALVDANAAVEAVLEQLKALVQDFIPDKATAQQYIEKIDSARDCLGIVKGINPDVIKQFADGIVPTVMECGGKHMGIADKTEKENAESSGMSPEDIKMFDDAGVTEVEAVIEQLKSLVRDFVTDKDKAQEYLSKIDSARGCLDLAKGMNPEIIKQIAKSALPTIMECGSQFIILKDPQERADKQSSGMTPDEIKMFDDASVSNVLRS